MMRAPLPLVLALAGAGCGLDPEDSATTRSEPPRPFEKTASPSASPPATPAAGKPSAHADIGFPALTAQGIVLRDRGRITSRYAFGAPRATVEAAMEAAIPGILDRRFEGAECGAGPMQFSDYGGLVLSFQDGRFVGWLLGGGSEITLANGIALGATRQQIEAKARIKLEPESTLDGEFAFVGGPPAFGGFFSDEGPHATIKAVHAGLNCFFR